MKKRIGWLMLLAAMCTAIWVGCGISEKKEGTYQEVAYTVVKSGEIPEEVKKLIADQQEKAFQMVYKSDGYLYVMRGYGRQKTGGYSIRILDVGTCGERLLVRSELIGPQTKEEQKGDGSCPYFVIKLEDPGCPVAFEESGGKEDGIDKEKSASDLQKE